MTITNLDALTGILRNIERYPGEAAHLDLEGVVQAGGAEPGEQLVGAGELHREPAADGDVPER